MSLTTPTCYPWSVMILLITCWEGVYCMSFFHVASSSTGLTFNESKVCLFVSHVGHDRKTSSSSWSHLSGSRTPSLSITLSATAWINCAESLLGDLSTFNSSPLNFITYSAWRANCCSTEIFNLFDVHHHDVPCLWKSDPLVLKNFRQVLQFWQNICHQCKAIRNINGAQLWEQPLEFGLSAFPCIIFCCLSEVLCQCWVWMPNCIDNSALRSHPANTSRSCKCDVKIVGTDSTQIVLLCKTQPKSREFACCMSIRFSESVTSMSSLATWYAVITFMTEMSSTGLENERFLECYLPRYGQFASFGHEVHFHWNERACGL